MSLWYGFVRSEKKDSLSHNRMYSFRHRSQFVVSVLPKPGFARRYCALIVPEGSATIAFRPLDAAANGESPARTLVPPGTAHLLEHCVFARETGGGLFRRMAALGAEADAWTGHHETVFTFTCSEAEAFDPALELLWTSVFDFDLEGVELERERRVVGSEIDLYADEPNSIVWQEMLASLYAFHGVREDILGSHEQLRAITAEHLMAYHRAFYHPSHMSLVLVGDFAEEELARLLEGIDARLAGLDPPADCERAVPEEPREPLVRRQRLALEVANPSFIIGFKDPQVHAGRPLSGSAQMLRLMAGELYLDTLLGPSSPLYQQLYDEGVINDSFQIDFLCERDYACVILSGEADDPDEAAELVTRRLREAIACDALDRHIFAVEAKALAGDFLRGLDSVEACGAMAVSARLYHMDLFDYPSIFSRITPEQAEADMAFLLDESCRTRIMVHSLATEEVDER